MLLARYARCAAINAGKDNIIQVSDKKQNIYRLRHLLTTITQFLKDSISMLPCP